MNAFRKQEALEVHLASGFGQILASNPDFIVPVPRKAIKVIKLYDGAVPVEAWPKIKYTTAFYWSPSLAELTAKRVAIVDDATIRGKTLLRHRRRFEEAGAQVDTYAIYKCNIPEALTVGRSHTGIRDRYTHVVKPIGKREYSDYALLLQHKMRVRNPLLEHDHYRTAIGIKAKAQELEEVFLSLAAQLGQEAIAYPYNLEGHILGASVSEPKGTTRLRTVASNYGISQAHIKLRMYLDTDAGTLYLVPMVFPDLDFRKDVRAVGAANALLGAIENAAPVRRIPGGAKLRSGKRLLYEMASYALAGELADYCEEEVRGLLKSFELTKVTSLPEDHGRRFGPELACVADAICTDSRSRMAVLEGIKGYLEPSQRILAMGQAPLQEAPPFGLSPSRGWPLYDLCLNTVSGLKGAWKMRAEANPSALDDRVGWSFSDLKKKHRELPPVVISEAIDFLCDNGYIVPWYPPDRHSLDNFTRMYRASEVDGPAQEADLVLGFIAFVVRGAMSRLPDMARGVTLTFANKLLANILLDLREMLPGDESEKLEPLKVIASRFGPEIGVSALVTGYQNVYLDDLDDFGFIIAPEAAGGEGGRRLSAPERMADIKGFEPATAHLVEALIDVYAAFYKSGRSVVANTLLPLAVYRRREDAYAYLNADLVFWISEFSRACHQWDRPAKRNGNLARAREVIDAFHKKYALARKFTAKWRLFSALVRKKSSVVADALDNTVDWGASEASEYGRLFKVAEVFERIQQAAEAVAEGNNGMIHGTLLGAASALEKCATVTEEAGRAFEPEFARANGRKWAAIMFNIAGKQFETLPEVEMSIEKRRARRLKHGLMTTRAIEIAERRGLTRTFVVMGDLLHSRETEEAMRECGQRIDQLLLDPLQRHIDALAEAWGGVRFADPNGDDFRLLFASARDSILFCANLCRSVVDFEASAKAKLRIEAVRARVEVIPKLGVVRSDSLRREEVEHAVFTCSGLIGSHPPMVNDGCLLTTVPLSELPEEAQNLARPFKSMPRGTIVRIAREDLAGIVE